MLGRVLLTGASPAVIAGTRSFDPAARLHLATEALLMEAHEVGTKAVATRALFGGLPRFWGIRLTGRGQGFPRETAAPRTGPCRPRAVVRACANRSGGPFADRGGGRGRN